MVRNTNTDPTGDRMQGPEKTDHNDILPSEIAELLARVKVALDEGKSNKAMDLIRRSKLTSPWVTNATAVCLLRSGETQRALEMLKGIVAYSSVCIRPDAPAVFVINFATALLMLHNVSGCLSALAELPDRRHPSAERLREVVRRWKSSLPLWQKLRWYWGDTPGNPLRLDFPPGDLR